MKALPFILRKEFTQIFRNKAMLPILFVMPVVQLMVLSFAATYELNQVKFTLVDLDKSSASREVIRNMQATGYFELYASTESMEEAKKSVDRGESKLIVHFGPKYAEQLKSEGSAEVQLIVDAVDGSSAGLIQSYMTLILADENISAKWNNPQSIQAKRAGGIELRPVNWYNPNLDYITFMVPGILVVLVSMIGLFLSGMNIVREREIGTIEQLNVSPISKAEFMMGKLIPFWVIGMFDLLVGLALARFGFQIPFLGSLATILVIAGIYMILIQALGLLISTITHTQQQAMFIAWFLMVVFILMGGLFTPIESMPNWAQELTRLNPVAYFIRIMRMVLLKGAGWKEVIEMVVTLSAMAGVLILVSVRRYKKTVG
jgi:ABC-2 type transport system permease protein